MMHLKYIIFILFYFYHNISGAQNCAGHILASSDRYIFVTVSNSIYCIEQSEWHKLPDVSIPRLSPGIASVDEEGNLWLFSPTQLFCYSQIRDSWRIFSLPQQLHQKIVSMETWRGNLWFSARDTLWQFNPSQLSWEQFPYHSTLRSGLLKRSPQNNLLWLDGIACFDGSQWYILPPLPFIVQFWPQSPQSFTWDNKGMPWLATVFGLYFFDTMYRCWRLVPGKRFLRCYSVIQFQGEIFASEYGDGLYKFSNYDWEKVKCPFSHSYSIFSLYQSQNCLWLESYLGMSKFNGQTWKMERDIIIQQEQIQVTWLLFVLILLLSTAIFIILWPHFQELA